MDILLFSSNPLKISPSATITIGTDQIRPSTSAKDLIVTLHGSISFMFHITNICEAFNYHPYRISWIKKYLTANTNQTIIHLPVSSRTDYRNSILYGLGKYQLNWSQMFLNSAARLITISGTFNRSKSNSTDQILFHCSIQFCISGLWMLPGKH